MSRFLYLTPFSGMFLPAIACVGVTGDDDSAAADSAPWSEGSAIQNAEVARIADLFLLGLPEEANSLPDELALEVVAEVLARRVPEGQSPDEYLAALGDEYGVGWTSPSFPATEGSEGAAPPPPSVVSASCGGYVSASYPAAWVFKSTKASSASAGYSSGPNCRMSAPGGSFAWGSSGWGYYGTDCGDDLMRDDMLSFFMGYNTADRSMYAANLTYWHSSALARSVIGDSAARVYEFAWSGSAPDHQYNVYMCIPWQALSYESDIVLKQRL